MAGWAGPVAGAAGNQPEPALQLVRADLTVTVGSDQVRRVDATYRFKLTSAGGEPSSLVAVEGTMWRFPDRTIGPITATVDGTSVTPAANTHARHLQLSVPVPGDGSGETTTVRLRYAVRGPPGRLRLPFWVPTAPAAGVDRVVALTVRLPDGSRAQGAAFPTVDVRGANDSVLTGRLSQMPGLTALRYGQGSPGVTLNQLLPIGGVGTIGALAVGWTVYRRRRHDRVD